MNDYARVNVKEFYSGKSVFVTGGTGYLGKALIEKLLYSCRNIDNIYVLLRDKKGERACDRVKQIINSTVAVVFHLAATVNFNEPLKDALAINLNGTEEIIKLCKQMTKLEAFIYVSTAFSNSDLRKIEEKVYPNTLNIEYVRSIAECFPNDEYVISKLVGNKPNTYTFTKALAEEVVLRAREDLPIAIVRPSIVISALKEPSPGWIDNWNGATGLFVGMSTGVMKVMIGKGDNVTDLVPLDIVINLIIVAAANCRRSSLQVFNCCTGKSNPITCNQAETIARRATYKHSLNYLPLPFMWFISDTILYNILRFALQLIPSYLMDFWLLINGKRATLLKIQSRIRRTVELMQFFLLNEWDIEDSNVRNLLNTLSEEDMDTFHFDVKSINWDECLENYVLGTRKHLVKNPRRPDKGHLHINETMN
ncbi:putative fatty acyl-CoA reductase CG5065 isoform X2 [Manduca sexta]|uniref:putative fatty acyl-CoA reductase CG5065 isoform X2 n=1 Tax=Manduca sexta TaxID=7130 RepID=UPI001182B927|nr:putative fatty acyl-CoA reductase CG5065 isoform X2 [Manduca sexta]